MTRHDLFSHLGILLLAGWCALFLRVDTVEESMVRAVLLDHEEGQFCVGLIYQAPEASTDAEEVLVQLRFASAQADTLERAWNEVENTLPKALNYRLCDYLLLSTEETGDLLRQYEALVLSCECGRTAAKVSRTESSVMEFAQQCEEMPELPDKLLEKLKRASRWMPRLYQQEECCLYPVFAGASEGFVQTGGVLCTAQGEILLSVQQAEVFQLVTGQSGEQMIHLGDTPIRLRRCVVSTTLDRDRVTLRLDCQINSGAALPEEQSENQLEMLCTRMVQTLWEQGIDVLGLEAKSTLKWGQEHALSPTKNACPEIRTDVCFW